MAPTTCAVLARLVDGQQAGFPRGQRGTKPSLDLADVVGELLFGSARCEGVLQAGKRRNVPATLDEGAGERRTDLLREATERERPTERADRLARAVVQEKRLTETPEQLRGGHALLRVLNSDPEDLLRLFD